MWLSGLTGLPANAVGEAGERLREVGAGGGEEVVGEDRDNGQVDQEGDQQGEGAVDREVLVGLAHLVPCESGRGEKAEQLRMGRAASPTNRGLEAIGVKFQGFRPCPG